MLKRVPKGGIIHATGIYGGLFWRRCNGRTHHDPLSGLAKRILSNNRWRFRMPGGKWGVLLGLTVTLRLEAGAERMENALQRDF